MTTRLLLRLALICIAAWAGVAGATPALQVGSKRFTESYVLGEIVTQTLNRAGVAAEHRQGLGNTAILAAALQQGQIDLYPEYTGTVVRELLQRTSPADAQAPLSQINTWLAPLGLKAAVPLGFNNSYALIGGNLEQIGSATSYATVDDGSANGRRHRWSITWTPGTTSPVTGTASFTEPVDLPKLSTSPAGFLRILWNVCKSAHSSVMRKPVRCSVMSHQCEPISASARDAPASSVSMRQFQSVSYNSQSCEYVPCTTRISPRSPFATICRACCTASSMTMAASA